MAPLILIVGLPFGVLLSAWWLTGQMRQYALSRRLLDIPNARSSHTTATPRGGGLAIVATALIALTILGAAGVLAWPGVVGLAGGGAIVATVGFGDDRHPIAPQWRLLGHVTGAGWVLWWLGGFPELSIAGVSVRAGWLGQGLAVLYLVWLINLTNFMDGIDGIAGVEAITVGVGGALSCVLAAPGHLQWLAPIALASAVLGFLFLNWPPAKIFMGDGGSGFLGVMLGAMSIQAAGLAPRLLWSWIILLSVFIVDATVTLIRRVIRGERFYEAHRSHAYQHAAQHRGHRAVTLAVGAINLGWLMPIALTVARGSLDGPIGALIAYTPLMVTALWLGAGDSSQQMPLSSPVIAAPRAWPPPRPALMALYVVAAAMLFGAYLYTVWTNQQDPGRAQAWIVRVRNAVNAIR